MKLCRTYGALRNEYKCYVGYTHAYTISPLQGFSGTFQYTEFFYYYSTEKTQGYCNSASLRFIIPSFSTLPLNITPVRRIDKDLQQVAFN